MDYRELFEPEDPFSKESLEAVDFVEALPQDVRFEHAAYVNRVRRVASYEYAHAPNDETDRSPITLPEGYTQTQFPEELQTAFLNGRYEITQLRVEVTDTPDETKISVGFVANGTPHLFVTSKGEFGDPDEVISTHATLNERGDPVGYDLQEETTLGVLAALAYAQQRYSQEDDESVHLSLDESTLFVDRPAHIELAERIVTTLGDFAGRSKVETTALFDTDEGTPILAKLTECEYPDKSSIAGTLTISEVDDELDIDTALNPEESTAPLIETNLVQRFVNVEQSTLAAEAGVLYTRYATEEITLPKEETPSFYSEVDPMQHPAKWSALCKRFAGVAKKAMQPFDYLED